MIKHIGNRASNNFSKALENIPVDDKVLIIYHDTLWKPPEDLDTQTYNRIYSLIDNKYTYPIDDKLLFGLRFNDSGIVPVTYKKKKDIYFEKEKLWFIKDPGSTGGKGVTCATSKELLKLKIPKGYIIQEGLTDIHLINNRKYTIRVYVLLWNNEMYLYDNGFCLVHGTEYTTDVSDYEIHIKHEGYDRPGSKIHMLPFNETDDYEIILDNLTKSMKIFKTYIMDIIEKTTEYKYTLLGIDVIPLSNKNVRIIEINRYPNLKHTRNINTKVNIPMLHDTISLMVNNTLNHYIQIE